jgi:23S rRNA (cytidine1920-2'-O)/16S rRNA (cytidine1409-2'-O)-methyltransferase
LTAVHVPPPDWIVADLSFISLEKALAPALALAKPGATLVALVKPQFEVGKGGTDHGVVRDPATHREVLERAVAAARDHGLGARDVIASPILGPQGNREFLLYLGAGPSCVDIDARIATVTGG